MDASATLSNYHQSPRKVRRVATLVKGKTIAIAIAELMHIDKRSGPVFAKLISSAVANAKQAGVSTTDLIVKSITVNKGVVTKRWMPRAHGRATPINKRSSHLTVIVSEKSGVSVKGSKDAKKKDVKSVKVVTPAKQIEESTEKQTEKKTEKKTKAESSKK